MKEEEESKNKQEEGKKDIFKEENEDLDMPRVRGHYRYICKGRKKCKRIKVKPHRRRLPTTSRRLYR